MYKFFFLLLSLTLLCLTCSKPTGNLIKQNERDFPDYKILFDEKAAEPLKETWPAFYRYIKEGHIKQQKEGCSNNAINYIYTDGFYNYFRDHETKIWRDPFFKQYDNILKIFGKPDRIYVYNENRIVFSYAIYRVGAENNQYTMITFVFDKETKLLHIEGGD